MITKRMKHSNNAIEGARRPLRCRAISPVLVVLGLLASDGSAMATPPTVTIAYSRSQDALCANNRRYQIHKEWEDELTENLAHFKSMWATVGPRWLTTTEKVTGKQFSRDKVTIHLTLCDLPSESSPSGISVNMRFALASFTKDPVPMRYKVSVVFHELLHEFVDNHLLANSALLN